MTTYLMHPRYTILFSSGINDLRRRRRQRTSKYLTHARDSACQVHLRERRLSSLARKLGHELDEDFRRAGNRLRDILIRDFDREMSLAEVYADRSDLVEAAYTIGRWLMRYTILSGILK
jgi:hypothetical protein